MRRTLFEGKENEQRGQLILGGKFVTILSCTKKPCLSFFFSYPQIITHQNCFLFYKMKYFEREENPFSDFFHRNYNVDTFNFRQQRARSLHAPIRTCAF